MVWKTYGPESDAAQANPLSNLVHIWSLRKLSTIIPNNRRIVEAIRNNADVFDAEGYKAASAFIALSANIVETSTTLGISVGRWR